MSQRIDVFRGDVVDVATGRCLSRLAYRGQRVGVIAVELLSRGQLDLFEMLKCWPRALDTATKLPDVRDWANGVAWRIHENMKPFGLKIEQVDDLVWSSRPEGTLTMELTTTIAHEHMVTAEAALAHGDYSAAARASLSALDACSVLLHAHQVLGAAAFLFGVRLEPRVQTAVANALCVRRGNLEASRRGLARLWRTEHRKGRWSSVPAAMERIEGEADEFSPVFDAAERCLESDLF